MPTWTPGRIWGAAVLAVATAATALEAELHLRRPRAAARGLGLSEFFLGVIVLAVVGNAAEYVSAVYFARQDQMGLVIEHHGRLDIQIALLVAPLLVLVSPLGHPMNLVFSNPAGADRDRGGGLHRQRHRPGRRDHLVRGRAAARDLRALRARVLSSCDLPARGHQQFSSDEPQPIARPERRVARAAARGGGIAAVIGTARWIRAAIRVWSWIKWPVIVVTGVLVPAVIWGAGIEPRLTDEVQDRPRCPGCQTNGLARSSR